MALWNFGLGIVEMPIRRIGDVIPEDRPVVGLVPDIGALVNRDLELNAAVEEVVDGLCRRLLHQH